MRHGAVSTDAFLRFLKFDVSIIQRYYTESSHRCQKTTRTNYFTLVGLSRLVRPPYMSFSLKVFTGCLTSNGAKNRSGITAYTTGCSIRTIVLPLGESIAYSISVHRDLPGGIPEE